ncbi:DUF6402 family protein [Cronobacter sakazakii]|uniref:DUF6402 family protein n=1 Tax=Cronobacter sakazakii TaxID=28141 RepID=UPI0021AF514C|nr:DUF6402 family protein [Cronobacter sakazakii]
MDQKIKELEGQSENYYTDIPMDACNHYVTLLNLSDQIVSNDKDGLYRIEINQIGLYVRDTYEFMNDGDDQPLGYWGWHGVIKPSLINEIFESKVVSKMVMIIIELPIIHLLSIEKIQKRKQHKNRGFFILK